MRKTQAILLAIFLIPNLLMAQQADSASYYRQRAHNENADFSFTETQLNEDDDAGQVVTSITGVGNDLYLSEVGYLFSPMRFRTRAYLNSKNDMFINGTRFNDAERGVFSYSSIGGLNDVTRNREGAPFFMMNQYGYTSVGGADNINIRAGQYASGHKLTLSGTNRNYRARGMYTYSTGLMENGWAFTGSLGYRWANEGYVEGTFYNSLSYLLGFEKRWGTRHSLSFTTWGSPTERGQQGSSTEEAYWLANDHYYNPNWGYQNGEKRNARVVHSYEPTGILTWDFKIDDQTKLSTSVSAKYSMYSTSALGWSGNAADPRPDYYKKLPSGQTSSSVYETLSDEDYATWLNAYNYWTSSKANRQIDWDGLYYANAQQRSVDGEALYYVERRHNDQLAFNLSSTITRDMQQYGNIVAGVNFSTTKGMHYKTMDDLLGADHFTDVDKFSVRDYGYNSYMVQNDLDNPNRIIYEDDKFGYNYNIFVHKADAWTNYQYNKNFVTLFFSGRLGVTSMEREGLMRNGRAANNSKGRSGKANFLEGGAKAAATFRISGLHSFNIGVGYEENAPLAYNAFIAPRFKNDFAEGLTNEEVISAEASYTYNGPIFSVKLSGFYTRFNNVTELDQFYNDMEERYTYLSMTGVEKEHMGVELGAQLKITSNLTLKALATYSNAEYINNPDAVLTYENASESTSDIAYIDGMKESGTPLSAYSLGLDYNIKGWFFSINGNYYNRGFIDFSTYRRLGNVLGVTQETSGTVNEDGTTATVAIPEQEEFDGGFMLDLSIGKYIRLKKGRSLSINLTLNNVTNNTDMKTGGYEQSRDDNYSDGTERSYVFSRNSKYYYAQGINGFLNIGYRF